MTLTTSQMIKIIKSKTISKYPKNIQKQIFAFAFGDEYMSQSDETKGTLQTYEGLN